MGKIMAIIPAAGRSSRMGGNVKKQYLNLAGKPLLIRTLQVFENCPLIDGFVLVTGPEEVEECRQLVAGASLEKLFEIVPGGAERQDSVFKGLSALPGVTSLVVVHDGARPLLAIDNLEAVIEAGYAHGAATLAVPVKDTIKIADSEQWVCKTLSRDGLWQIQTPQVFAYEQIMESHRKAQDVGLLATDDAALVEAFGGRVKLVKGSYGNIKITTPEDLLFAEMLLEQGGNFV